MITTPTFDNMPANTLVGMADIQAYNLADLEEKCPPHYDRLPPNTHPKRQKEWLATRLILWELTKNKNTKIIYNKFGKPLLSSHHHIGISHSQTTVVLILHPSQNIGIDIQEITSKILRIKAKFLTPFEQSLAGQQQDILTDLTLYWTVKESLYKLYGKKKLTFIKNLPIHKHEITNEKQGIVTASIRLNGTEKMYQVHYMLFQQMVMSYVFEEVIDNFKHF